MAQADGAGKRSSRRGRPPAATKHIEHNRLCNPEERAILVDSCAMESTEATRLLAACTEARNELDGLRFGLELPGAQDARERASASRAQLDNYVLPRLIDIDAPALIVIGGSTGSGKSTLTNSLLGEQVTTAGVLRPTTRSPVLICHPDSVGWFGGARVLGDLARVSGQTASGHAASRSASDNEAAGLSQQRQLELVTTTRLARTLAILDAPDIDSVVDANRELAAHLLDAADVWLFVTTAARYADALPWKFLQDAARRGVSLAMVLNRVPPGAGAEIGEDLQNNLRAHDLNVHLFTIEEQALVDGRIPPNQLSELTGWITHLGADQQARAHLVLGTLSGTLNDLRGQLLLLADATDAQHNALIELGEQVDQEYARAHNRISQDLEFGTVLRGEVLARWQDVVGTGELLRQLESKIGRLRDKFTAAVRGRPTQATELEGAIELGVEQLVRAHAGEAAQAAYHHWSTSPAGQQLLAHNTVRLDTESDLLAAETNRMVRHWQSGILEHLREEGADKRTTAKALSYGINGVALVTMVSVFAHTGGLTGAEVAIAGGSSAAGQKVLEAVLGDQVVRRLAERARHDLADRVKMLLANEAERFHTLLSSAGTDQAASDRLRHAAVQLEVGR